MKTAVKWPRSESADNYSDRIMGILISASGVIVFLTHLLPAINWAEVPFNWWQAASGLVVMIYCILLLSGIFLPLKLLYLGWVVVIALNSFVGITMFAGHGPPLLNNNYTWIWALQSIMTAHLVLLVSLRSAIVLSLLISMLPVTSAWLFMAQLPHYVLIDTLIHMSDVILVVLLSAMRERLRLSEKTLQMTLAQKRTETLRVSELEMLEETSRLLHDKVLSVLVFAGMVDGTPTASLRQQAKDSLQLFEVTGIQDKLVGHETRLCAEEFSAAMVLIDPECEVVTSFEPGLVPIGVWQQLTDASLEALRNKVRHTKDGTHAHISAFFSPEEVTITIADDGGGFDLHKIDRGKLGVRKSILERTRRLEGGSAEITVENEKTIVSLRWHA